MKSRLSFPHRRALIADAWPRARTRVGRECRSRGLRLSQHFVYCVVVCLPERTWALDVADDGSGLVVHELDAALGDTTTGACVFRQPAVLAVVLLPCAASAPPQFLPRPSSCVPVRPRTRVTLTSLTGALAVSMMCDFGFDVNRSFRVEVCGESVVGRCGTSGDGRFSQVGSQEVRALSEARAKTSAGVEQLPRCRTVPTPLH